MDGVVNFWNPSLIAGGSDEALVASLSSHTAPVNSLHFNPHARASNLIASGGDSQVLIFDLANLESPTVFSPAPPTVSGHTAEITWYLISISISNSNSILFFLNSNVINIMFKRKKRLFNQLLTTRY